MNVCNSSPYAIDVVYTSTSPWFRAVFIWYNMTLNYVGGG